MILCKEESRNTIMIMVMTGKQRTTVYMGAGQKDSKKNQAKTSPKGPREPGGLVLDASTFLWGHSAPAASDTKWGGWTLALVHTDYLGTVFPLQPEDIWETRLHILSVKTMAHWLLCRTSSGRVELVHMKTCVWWEPEDVVYKMVYVVPLNLGSISSCQPWENLHITQIPIPPRFLFSKNFPNSSKHQNKNTLFYWSSEHYLIRYLDNTNFNMRHPP